MKSINKIIYISVLNVCSLYVHASDEDSLLFQEPNLKSQSTAYFLAIGSTLIPTFGFPVTPAIGFSGIIIGPSVGQFYAGSLIEGAAGILVRGIGMLLIMNGVENILYFGDQKPNDSNPGLKLMGGIVLFSGAFVYSFLDTHSAVINKNERIKEKNYKLIPSIYIKEKNTICGNIKIIF